uniref:Major facilitator superfamily (MFS) profile domain-containing protein n=1 Tax=Heliothis virescens TaxID=7102 RepID=A0A2A4J566_HELVI
MESGRRTSSSEHLVYSDFEDDYVVKSIGAFGVWQATVCTIAALVRSAAIWNMLSIIFLTPATEFVCVKFEDNATVVAVNSTCYNNCVEYMYYEEVLEKTLISEFGLICDEAWKTSFTQSMLMFGFLLGVSLFGWISDRFGRRIGLIISCTLNITFMLAVPFSQSYWMFSILRLFIGMASGGTMIISLVFIIEIVGPQHREAAGSLAIMPDGLAQGLLSVFAYYSVDWRMFLMEYAIASVFIYMFIIFLPESPRWLMSKGNAEKTLDVMTRAAKRNKLNTALIRENIAIALDEILINDKEIRKSSYVDLFRNKTIAFKTISSIIIWISAGVCYFGINQYVTFIGSNVYITVILLGSIQIPTCPLAMMLNKTFGRRASTVATLTLIGITMAILMFVPPGHTGCTILGIIGFAATCTTFGVLCVYVSELFPTPLRTMAYGLSSGGAKIGAMVAPFIATINPHWIPSMIFAVLPFIASLFGVLLPETKGRQLQDML